MGVVAQTRPPCFSGVIFAPIEFSHWRQRQADFSETINRTRMRPRYTWSAVSACSESRDRFLKFGRGHFRYDVISGSIGCLATRPRYSCSAARTRLNFFGQFWILVQSHKIAKIKGLAFTFWLVLGTFKTSQ